MEIIGFAVVVAGIVYAIYFYEIAQEAKRNK